MGFRVAADASKYYGIYLRPTNARADDQVRRNHSTQYISFPDYLWLRLRTETPGKYEYYVDHDDHEGFSRPGCSFPQQNRQVARSLRPYPINFASTTSLTPGALCA